MFKLLDNKNFRFLDLKLLDFKILMHFRFYNFRF